MTEFFNQLLHEIERPLTNPVLIFSLILFIILLSPILLRRLNIPGIIGLIIAGVIIGPHGLYILEKNSAINLFSTIGLLYIMFIAGLELDLNEFKSHRNKSLVFGFFTFIIPLGIGFPVCHYLLYYDFNASLLTASMFATHTLVAYPIVSKFGVSKNQAVAITVGGTILTDTAVLIILAVIMGNSQGNLNQEFWIRLGASLIIFSAIMFTITITVVAYVPIWQDGLGETIIQGYYMHQGVGMWFMLFTLGIVYYMLPQQLNRPIYSYSLGILAFWTQILFYTLIGTHHFVFSAIPWWLQTVAIVGSVGMVIPVVAGTTNFVMTFKGAWHKIAGSYTLPFFLVGIIFYFTGSLQGTAEAFRSTNLMWHFTDFTVAHSHLTMYGIICFFLWAGMYAVIPRLTGKEAPQITVGAHFWLALIGLMFYTVPLMIGSTLRGQMWIAGKPFIDSVVQMAPYWLWRAIGGSLMWLSHIFFAYNFYKMVSRHDTIDVKEAAIEKLMQATPSATKNV